MTARREFVFAIFAFVIMTLIVFAQMPHAFINISTMAYGTSDDGLKTYFTYLYHLKYDESFLHFGGMNYPFGEHIVFTDNQPALAVPMMAAVNAGLPISAALTVFNALILFALLLTAPIVYYLARHFKIDRVPSLILAVILALFSPQIIRMPGHEGLAHVSFLPLIWLLALKFFERPTLKMSFTIAAILLFFAGIHPYNLIIAVALISGLWMFSFRKAATYHYLIQAIAPLALYGAWARLSDPVRDRVLPQTSAFYYRAYFESVFLPYEGSPFRPLIDRVAHLHQELPIESIAYVGLVGCATLVWLIFRFLRKAFETRSIGPVNPSLAAAILILLYSFGYPWRLIGEDLFRHLGPLSQFRALGRFAWVFFWIYGIFAFEIITRQRRWVVIGALSLTAFEAYSWSHPIFTNIERVSQSPPGIQMSDELEILVAPINLKEYQAFIPLPYFQAGSEGVIPKEVRERNLPRTFADAMGLAYQTGLPMVAQSLSRTSITQSEKIFGFLTGNRAGLRKDLPNSLPLLLVVGPEPKMEFERKLIESAELVAKSENYQLYRLTP